MPSTEERTEGLPARRAALQTLDAVLRRGQTVEAAAGRATNLVPVDRALSTAIAGETLRRIPDLDALIDSATRQRLPDDSKARTVLRLALAQKVGLGSPDHAIVATALPQVDGGPRRLVHGVLATLLRRGVPALESCRLPEAVEERWLAAWGEDAILAARRLLANRPPLNLTIANDFAAKDFAQANGGRSLASRNVRHKSSSVADLPGFGTGGWWVQDLAASLTARLLPHARSE